MRVLAKFFFALAPIVWACSTNFSARTCKVDTDCEANQTCTMVSGVNACVDTSAVPIRIGMSAPLGGPNHELGAQMQAGVNLAFKAQNDNGGINGRQLVLDVRDDLYDPPTAEANARSLLDVVSVNAPPRCPSTEQSTALYPDGGAAPVSTTELDRGPNAALAILGNVGTPTMVRFAPIAVETQTLFFGAFTGASLILRDSTCGSCSRYIFNVRASYEQEARATVLYFLQYKGVPDYQHLISFDQDDTYGQAGYTGLTDAYTSIQAHPPAGFSFPAIPAGASIPRFRYERPYPQQGAQTAVTAIVDHIKKDILANNTANHTVGILMTDVYSAASTLITGLRDWQASDTTDGPRVTFQFSNISFVGPNALADSLTASNKTGLYTQNVYVSQVVPNYVEGQDDSSLVQDYRRAVPQAGDRNFTALEGYIDARIFIAGLLAAPRGAYTTENLINAFENLHDTSLVLGLNSGFSQSNHNYSKAVWGTSIQADGSFKNIYLWQQGTTPELQQY